jgi:hypothetical protein
VPKLNNVLWEYFKKGGLIRPRPENRAKGEKSCAVSCGPGTTAYVIVSHILFTSGASVFTAKM